MTDSPATEPTDLPYVFLDVDGVLNAIHQPRDPYDHRMLTVSGASFPIHVRHAVLAWLRTLGDRADVRWATTWEDHANDVLTPAFDLPTFPVACRDVNGSAVARRRSPWKLAGVLAALRDDPRPFAWVDDDAIPRPVDEHFEDLGVPYLCVTPHLHHGLSNRHLREIDAFLDQQR